MDPARVAYRQQEQNGTVVPTQAEGDFALRLETISEIPAPAPRQAAQVADPQESTRRRRRQSKPENLDFRRSSVRAVTTTDVT